MAKKLLSLALLMSLALALLAPAALADTTMYVYTENRGSLNVRSSEGVGNNVVGKLAYGTKVTVVTIYNGWAMIYYPYGDPDGYYANYAYVQSRYLVKTMPGTPTPAPSGGGSSGTTIAQLNAQFRTGVKVAPYTVISRPSRASGWVNLRWAPSTDAERIATCPQGKELLVLAELRDWYQVQDPATGMIGFINRQFVTLR